MRQQRMSPPARPPPRRTARATAFSLFHGSACTRIRTGAAASLLVASRYSVVTFGLIEKWKAPVVRITRSCFHGPPALDLCTTAPRTPRTTPLNLTLVPGAIAGLGDGGTSDRTPMLNHDDRRASAPAAVAPPTPAVSWAPRESDVTSSVFTRRDELRWIVASTVRPAMPSARPSVFP